MFFKNLRPGAPRAVSTKVPNVHIPNPENLALLGMVSAGLSKGTAGRSKPGFTTWKGKLVGRPQPGLRHRRKNAVTCMSVIPGIGMVAELY